MSVSNASWTCKCSWYFCPTFHFSWESDNTIELQIIFIKSLQMSYFRSNRKGFSWLVINFFLYFWQRGHISLKPHWQSGRFVGCKWEIRRFMVTILQWEINVYGDVKKLNKWDTSASVWSRSNLKKSQKQLKKVLKILFRVGDRHRVTLVFFFLFFLSFFFFVFIC